MGVQNTAPFPLEATGEFPAPGMTAPGSFSFSDDDTHLTYLLGEPADPWQRLWEMETTTGTTRLLLDPGDEGIREASLPLTETLRRQRERNRATGVASYVRAQSAQLLLIPLRNGLYTLDGLDGRDAAIQCVMEGGDIQTPALSPTGDAVAFVRNGEVFVASLAAPKRRQPDALKTTPRTTPRQITHGGRAAGVTHGLAEYVAQEELARREGLWWAPDGRWIAFEEVDEGAIPRFVIPHLGLGAPEPQAREEHHYPFAGAANARFRLGVVAARGGAPVWMDLDFGEEVYLAQVFWRRDGALGAIVVNRPQRTLWLVRFNPSSGQRTTVLTEHSDLWLHVPARGLIELETGEYVWASERSGFRHLYVYAPSGELLRSLTAGEWVVDDLLAVDLAGQMVYFTGNRDDPREKHLYAVPLTGGDIRRITPEPGTHDVVIDHGCRRFVDTWSAVDQPPVVTLRTLADGARLHAVPTSQDPRVEMYQLTPPEFVTLPNRGGDLLYGAIYRPDPAFYGPGPYPTIVSVYGGPHAQEITNSWGRMTANLTLQYLRKLGFLIFALDNRGSARRGLRFESALAKQFSRAEVDDQVDGVRWLVAQGWCDPQRVGVTGWSYGGYMSLMCLAQAPDIFRVAVAGAPVTDYAGYDTAYTERYLETPATNSEGYRASSVFTYAEAIRGKLLLIHGMLDENVHFRHSARLLEALIHANTPVDTVFFSDERHMLRFAPNRVYMNEQIVAYFLTHL